MTLTDFLLARVAEDEGQANFWAEVQWPSDDCTECSGASGEGVPEFDPARVLAECEAKRRIVELFHSAVPDGDGWSEAGWSEAGWRVLCEMSAVYADRPDYNPEWKP